MCGDTGDGSGATTATSPDSRRADGERLITRRRLLVAAGGVAADAGGIAAGRAANRSSLAETPSDHALAATGQSAFSMAMHIHSSFSEMSGSMESQLIQAQLNNVDVLWWTDHDHRMEQAGFRNAVHFTSLTDEATDGKPWHWQQETAGSLTSDSGGRIVDSPASPNDPVARGSLSLTAQSTSTARASLGFYADSRSARLNYQGNLYGQTLTVDILPTDIGPDAYLELALTTSYHGPSGGRPAGIYTVAYHFGGARKAGTRSTVDLTAIVNVPVVPNEWNTVALTPCDDIAALWPDLPPQDFASWKLNLNAVSTGGLARGFFDYLRFGRRYTSGDVLLQTQKSIGAAYASRYPTVAQRQGLEISLFNPHLNWFGGAVSLPDYTGITSSDSYVELMKDQVSAVHGAGGVVSYNHPYGTGAQAALPQATQDEQLTEIGRTLLDNKALGCDILEVGYPLKGGVEIGRHLGLWDILNRNAMFLTGNGTSDDHGGQDWKGIQNNWITSVWASDNSEAQLIAALQAGRAWAGSLASFAGTLDLLVDGTCPMGSASVSAVGSRNLQVLATGLPADATLQVLRGGVDFAGRADPRPNTSVVASYPASALTGGSVVTKIDTRKSCFVRTQVKDSTGAVIAFSNPVWLLRSLPATGIPTARAR